VSSFIKEVVYSVRLFFDVGAAMALQLEEVSPSRNINFII